MENNLYNFLIILAGVAWIILALFVLSIFRCIAQLRVPKPNNSRWEREWKAIEESLRK